MEMSDSKKHLQMQVCNIVYSVLVLEQETMEMSDPGAWQE